MTITVNSGDTLSSIAREHSVSWQDAIVIQENVGIYAGGTLDILLQVGDSVIFTEGKPYTITGPKDTLMSIGRNLGVEWTELIILRPAPEIIGSSYNHLYGDLYWARNLPNDVTQIGDAVFVIHTGCNCGDAIPESGITSSAEQSAEETGESNDVEANAAECDDPRTHFVIHQTVAGNLNSAKVASRYGGRRSKAHCYIFKDGSSYNLWPFTEKNVWATKAESRKDPPGKGKMIHIEIDYEDGGSPNDAQYNKLADIYIEANRLTCKYLVIVPHIEVDRGIPNGHKDPQNFDYNKFYSVLSKKGADIASIEKFDHNRYWGDSSYKVPWGSDKFNWPPILSGKPH